MTKNDKVGICPYGSNSVVWICDGDIGASVGEYYRESKEELEARLSVARQAVAAGKMSAQEDVEFFAVELAAKEWAKNNEDAVDYKNGAICLPNASASLFKKYLRTILDTIKHCHDSTPWPEWAIKAQAEGWKAPKGWKP